MRVRAGVLIAIGAVAVLLVVQFDVGGRLHDWLDGNGSSTVESEEGASVDSRASTTTTSRPPVDDYDLYGRTYSVGDCVIWDQGESSRARRGTQVVPCDQPHLLQMTGSVEVDAERGTPFPTEDDWRLVIEDSCGPLADQLVGGTLDSLTYWPSAITPVEEGWTVGDRRMWCGIAAFGPPDDDRDLSEWTGDLRGSDVAPA